VSYDQTNQDQLYIEDGYFTPDGYYVYIAEAKVDLTPYIDEGYIDTNYYEYYGGVGTFACDFDVVAGGQIEEANADLTATASISAQIAITKVADSAISAVANQTTIASRTQEGASAVSAQVSQTTVAVKTVSADINAGALFSPSITVEAVKNMTAVIDCVSTVTASTQATKVFNITLSSIVTQSLQGVYTASAVSNLSSAFTSTIIIGKLKETSSTLSSSTTLNLAKYIDGARPLDLTGSFYQFVTSPKQYGTHAINVFANREVTSPVDTTLIPNANQQFVVEFWWQAIDDKLATSDPVIMYLGTGTNAITAISSTTAWAIGIETNDSTQVHQLQFRYRDSNNQIQTIAGTISDYITKTHIAVRRGSDGVIRLYKDNTQIASASYSGTFSISAANSNSKLTFSADEFSIGPATGVMFDEFSYRIGTSDIVGYSQAIENDPDTQKALYHFDNSLADDLSVFERTSANISCTSSQTSQARVDYKGTANLSVISSQTASAIKTVEALASLNAAFSQTASAEDLDLAEIALSSTFTLQAQVDDLDIATANLTSEFTLTASTDKLKGAVINAGAMFTPTIDCQATRVGDIDLSVNSIVTAQPDNLVKSITCNLSSAFTLSAQALDLDLAQANLSSAFTLSAQSRYTARGTGNLSTISTVSADGRDLNNTSWYNFRSVLHFDDNLFDSVSETTLTGSVGSYVTSQSNFGKTAVSPSQIILNRPTGTYNTAIGTQNFIYDIKLKARTYNESLYSGTIVRFVDAVNNDQFGGDYYYDLEYLTPTATTIRVRLIQRSASSSSTNTILDVTDIYKPTDNDDIVYRLWTHVKLVRLNGVIYLYIDGQQQTSAAFSENLTSAITIASDKFLPGGAVQFTGKLDESALRIGEDITAPATLIVPSHPYKAFTLFYSDLYANSNISIDYLVAVLYQAQLQNTTTQLTNGQRLRYFDSNIASLTTVNSNSIKIVNAQSTIAGSCSQTVSVDRVRNNNSNLSVITAQTADNSRIRDITATLANTSSLQISVSKFTGNQANLSSASTLSTLASRTRTTGIQTDSIATQLTVAFRNATGTVLLESVAEVTANVIKNAVIAENLVASTQVSAEARSLVVAEANLNSTATQTTLATKFRPAEASLSSAFSISVTAVKTTNVISNNTVLTTQSTSAQRLRGIDLALDSAFTQTTQGLRVKVFTVNVNTSASILATVYSLVQFNSSLSSTGFIVTVGSVEHIDPYTTYMIPQETRAFQIDEEPRLYSIDPETRVNIIKGSLL